MSKVAVSAFIAVVCLFYTVCAECPFSTRINVTWDTTALGWALDGELVPEVTVAAGKIGLFNVTSGVGGFYISSKDCSFDTQYALSRSEGVTNNACFPPCTVAFNLTTGYYYLCSTSLRDSTSSVLHVLDCPKMAKYRCGKVVGCGMNTDDNKCEACIEAKNRGDCEKLENCTWCKADEVCLHEKSGACRAQIERDSGVASWVWLLITLCALLVLIAVLLTLFISERNFRQRWAAIAKADKDFAEVGKGANDGLMATD